MYGQQSSLISMNSTGSKKQENLEPKRQVFRKIPIVSHTHLDPKDIYKMWKAREEMKDSFDLMKDKTYLREDDSARGTSSPP